MTVAPWPQQDRYRARWRACVASPVRHAAIRCTAGTSADAGWCGWFTAPGERSGVRAGIAGESDTMRRRDRLARTLR